MDKVRGAPRRVPALVVLLVGVLLGMVAGRQLSALGSVDHIPPGELRLMNEAWRTIQENYVDRRALGPRKLAQGGIAGMVAALGDTGHSTFLTPAMDKIETSLVSGRFEGIGAELRMRNGHPVVVAPLDGSPAQRAGVRPGDVILQVDGVDLTGKQLPEVVEKIKGPAGSSVTLRIITPATGRTRDLRLTRTSIALQNVSWHRLPGTRVAHLRIAAFSKDLTLNLRRVLGEIRAQRLRGVILDLRDDPGGILAEAVGVISQFVPSGKALLIRDAEGRTAGVSVLGQGLGFDLPMVVLMNRGSASASEITAGALRDARRALLVGETTFGTGTVLKGFPLSDGSKLLLAVEEWLTPSGQQIWHKGIHPDSAVALPADEPPLFPEMERNLTAAALRKSRDAQLLKALSLLERPVAASEGRGRAEADEPEAPAATAPSSR